jgi:hypothetical protein
MVRCGRRGRLHRIGNVDSVASDRAGAYHGYGRTYEILDFGGVVRAWARRRGLHTSPQWLPPAGRVSVWFIRGSRSRSDPVGWMAPDTTIRTRDYVTRLVGNGFKRICTIETQHFQAAYFRAFQRVFQLLVVGRSAPPIKMPYEDPGVMIESGKTITSRAESPPKSTMARKAEDPRGTVGYGTIEYGKIELAVAGIFFDSDIELLAQGPWVWEIRGRKSSNMVRCPICNNELHRRFSMTVSIEEHGEVWLDCDRGGKDRVYKLRQDERGDWH